VEKRVTIRVVRRADGMLDYSKEAPGHTMKTLVPPTFEKLEAQLEANCVLSTEREKVINDVNLVGEATISFPARYHKFFSLQ